MIFALKILVNAPLENIGCQINILERTYHLEISNLLGILLISVISTVFLRNTRKKELYRIMKIGYARISTPDQKMDYQVDLLNKHGCEKIIEDEMTGSLITRPGLNILREVIRAGDTVVIWKLDRLGRTLKHLIELAAEFKAKDVQLISITEAIDTTTPMGQYTFHMFAAMAEFERNLISERSKAGMALAKARGKSGGRPFKLDKDKVKMAFDMYESQKFSVDQIASAVGVSRNTVYRYLNKNS
jgi:DNA invertase Pin-like site-specific DNA recombinase